MRNHLVCWEENRIKKWDMITKKGLKWLPHGIIAVCGSWLSHHFHHSNNNDGGNLARPFQVLCKLKKLI